MNEYNLHEHRFRLPPSPAPRVIPTYSPNLKNAAPNMLKQHLFYYIYVWMKSHDSFWMFPVHIDADNNVYGYLWDKDKWKYTSFPYSDMDSFY